ncbi:MAG TPA: hypothetical protein VHD87_05375 [Acidimicrobiales bacterium]|nr:hypothetical protein [Acidimicrobiales bacterium]
MTAGRFLRQVAFGLMLFVIAFGSFFVAGETFGDPGGLAAVGLVALWAVPLVTLSWLAWRQPDAMTRVLRVATAIVVAMNLLFAATPHVWRRFENGHGPVRAIAAFTLAGALTFLAWKRPREGGSLLVVVGLLPVLTVLRVHGGQPSLIAASTPAFVAGCLFVVSAFLAPDDPQRTATSRRSARRPGPSPSAAH